MQEVSYISLAEILALYEQAMRLSGQTPAKLVRPGDIERAVQHPRVRAWYQGATLAELAVDLAMEIGLAHAFVDGNKRLAVLAARSFLVRNGIIPPDEEYRRDFPNAFVAAIAATNSNRERQIDRLVEMVQRWVDASAPS